MEENEIIERIDKFFDKEGLDIQSKYFLTKKMNEEYWEEILSEGGGDEDLLGEIKEEEQETEEEPSEEIAQPKPIKKKKIKVRKPKVAVKKEETKETPKEQKEGEDESI